jgi:pimeloyl-ACP methyl ester carboxylesterase
MLEVNGVDLCVETFGEPRDPALLLIGGASMPMDWWHDGLCRALAGAGRFVVRYDHRDTGRSTTYPPGAPGYGFDDLVADAVGLIDRLGMERVHLVGVSMGGGIAQRIALDHTDRVETQTLIATSPGLRPGARTDGDLPPMTPALLAHFRGPRPELDWTDRDALIELVVAGQRRLAGEGTFDATLVRRIAARAVDRSRDLRAAQTNHGLIDPGEPYRSRLARTRVPTLVVHGTADPLFPLGHGEALAREIPDADLVRLNGVGHQVPPPASWGRLVPALVWHVRGRVRLGEG